MTSIELHTDFEATYYLIERLQSALHAKKRVLWLVSGGSSIAVAVTVSQALSLTNGTSRLTVMLTDERFGPTGHPQSNWQQLLDAGLRLPQAELIPLLQDKTLSQTVQLYERNLEQLLVKVDFRIGLFGLGADGHTAGILPHSPALKTKRLVASYTGPDYQRITMTPEAIYKIDEAVVYAVGTSKRHTLEQLVKEIPLDTQPAQALKCVKKLTIFTNQNLGENV